MENFTAAERERCPSLTEDKLEVKIIKILAYSIVLIVSLFGNSVIIATVIRNRRMQTTVNYLIANMAASDLFISVFAVPMKISEIVKGPRRFLIEGSVGLIFCQRIYFFPRYFIGCLDPELGRHYCRQISRNCFSISPRHNNPKTM